MNGFFNFQYLLQAYGDVSVTQAPKQKNVDWKKDFLGLIVQNPSSTQFTVPPLQTMTLFNGARTLAANGSTTWTLTQNPLNASTYRLSWAGGTDPVIRTDRTLAFGGDAITVAVNANGSAVFSKVAGGANFSAVQAGDQLWVPGPATGDAATPFSTLNQGLWTVLSPGTYSITATRLPGETFSAVNETQTLATSAQLQAFSSDNVQPGDSLDISAGFSAPAHRTFSPLITVTSTFVEFTSTLALSLQSNIGPGASGIVFYSNGKRLVFLEADQESAVQINGDAGQTQRLSPFVAGDQTQVASFFKVGPCWSVSVVNRSSNALNLTLVTAS